MASNASSAGSSAASARRQAQTILGEGRFHEATVARPLRGLLHAIGRVLESPVEGLEELVARIGGAAPGGTTLVWGVLAAVALAALGLIATHTARRALAAPAGGASAADGIATLSAAELEHQALAAERQGRYGDSTRLRFRAGLLRLAERELVAVSPAMRSGEVSRALGSSTFDELARQFDEIAYGGRPAGRADVERARREWSSLLGGKRGPAS